MASTALIVKVPQAEAMVGDLRARFDAVSQLGVPAHITILFPFMAPDQVTQAVLQRVQAVLRAVPAFAYSLESAGRFEATAFLAPTPAEPFVALTAAVAGEFSDFPPYAGQHDGTIPHLTVAHGNVEDVRRAAAELQARLRSGPAVRAVCDTVSLFENSSGRWREMHVFKLARPS